MQPRSEKFGDASSQVQSLEDVYYYGGQQRWSHAVIVDDEATSLKAGDLVSYHGNHWNGLAKVSSLDKGVPGSAHLVPAFKFETRLLSVPFGPRIDPPRQLV